MSDKRLEEVPWTKGPWTLGQIINEEADLISRGGTFLGLNTGQGAPDQLDAADYAEFVANCHLIAESPAMAALLEEMVRLFADVAGDCTDMDQAHAEVSAIEAVRALLSRLGRGK